MRKPPTEGLAAGQKCLGLGPVAPRPGQLRATGSLLQGWGLAGAQAPATHTPAGCSPTCKCNSLLRLNQNLSLFVYSLSCYFCRKVSIFNCFGWCCPNQPEQCPLSILDLVRIWPWGWGEGKCTQSQEKQELEGAQSPFFFCLRNSENIAIDDDMQPMRG